MLKIIRFLKRNLFPLLLIVITGVLCWRNFTPGTWLSGWDTLHPEFDFPLNLKRVIDGVWREEQGLGAVAAHSHMADLPRILFLWLLSLIFPLNTLRYLYVFLCLILGPLGVYWFIKYVFLASPRKNPSGLEFSTRRVGSARQHFAVGDAGGESVKLSSFLGALFYLLNFGTLQHFYVPFEMFPTLYAALPWLFLYATKFIQKRKQKYLMLFSLITFLSTSMAYAAHLWYVYFLCLLLYLFTLSFINKRFKPTVILILVTLIINSYWLLPNLYFLLNHAKDVPLAKTNRLFSEEAFLANKEFATVKDTAILKNFLFEWSEYVGGGKFDYLLDEWRNHLANPKIKAIGYAAFGLIVLGIFESLAKKRRQAIALLPVFLACFLSIVNIYYAIEGSLSTLTGGSLDIIREGLRFSFTKFSIPLMFAYAVFSAQGVNLILGAIDKITKKSFFSYILLVTCYMSLVIYLFPAFQGSLISPSMRIKIPQEYFDLFIWSKKQEKVGRVAHFPIHSPYGWTYYDWGFQGSGFLWFGIKQPVLNRDFDRWNPANEQFYREASYALYSQNVTLLEKVLEKHQVRWILVDENVIAPENNKQKELFYFKQMKDLFAFSNKIKHTQKFGPKINVYEYELGRPESPFFYLDSYLQVEPKYLWSYQDQAYWDYGNYISIMKPKNIQLTDVTSVFYSFRTFLDEKEMMPENLLTLLDHSYLIKENNEIILLPYLTAVDLNILDLEYQPISCGHVEPKFTSRNKVNNHIEYVSKKGSLCDHFDFPKLFYHQGYLLVIEARHQKGLPLRICLTNYKSRKCDLYASLTKSKDFKKHFFIVPPMGDYGAGFDLNIDNYSVGSAVSINDLKSIKIYSFPYQWLKAMKTVKEAGNTGQKTKLLVFNQSFENSWHVFIFAPPLSLKRLTNHVLVNNWANGWLLDETRNMEHETRMYIVFLPQLLEYLGFGLWLAVPLLIISSTRKVKKPKPFGF